MQKYVYFFKIDIYEAGPPEQIKAKQEKNTKLLKKLEKN